MSAFQIIKLILLAPLWLLIGLACWTCISLLAGLEAGMGPVIMGVVSLVLFGIWLIARRRAKAYGPLAEGSIRELRSTGDRLL